MLKSQKYSSAVFNSVAALANEDKNTARQYKALCKRSGGIFRTVGLVQFITFLAAKGQRETHYQWLAEHLRAELETVNALNSKDIENCMTRIRAMDIHEYMQVSRSVLALLQWHKRIAEILIDGTADTEDD